MNINNFKEIHIGSYIQVKTKEMDIEMSRICNFMNCEEENVHKMFEAQNLDTNILLRWSKLLEYDFFRIYSHHLILYAPQANINYKIPTERKTQLPQFRKNIYTLEIIDFILEMINSGEKTKKQIVEEYNIPKSTLYKWLEKSKR